MNNSTIITTDHLIGYAFNELSPEMEEKVEAHLETHEKDAATLDGILDFALHKKLKNRLAYEAAIEEQRQLTIAEYDAKQTTDKPSSKRWWLLPMLFLLGGLAYFIGEKMRDKTSDIKEEKETTTPIDKPSNTPPKAIEYPINTLPNVPATDIEKTLEFYHKKFLNPIAGDSTKIAWEKALKAGNFLAARTQLEKAVVAIPSKENWSGHTDILYHNGMLQVLVVGGDVERGLEYLEASIGAQTASSEPFSGYVLAYVATNNRAKAKAEFAKNEDFKKFYSSTLQAWINEE